MYTFKIQYYSVIIRNPVLRSIQIGFHISKCFYKCFHKYFHNVIESASFYFPFFFLWTCNFDYFIYLFFILFFNLQWILSYIEMEQPWVYMCSPSRSPLPPPSPPAPSWFLKMPQRARSFTETAHDLDKLCCHF